MGDNDFLQKYVVDKSQNLLESIINDDKLQGTQKVAVMCMIGAHLIGNGVLNTKQNVGKEKAFGLVGSTYQQVAEFIRDDMMKD